MATIKVDISQIEDHLAQENSIRVTSFSWNTNGYRGGSEPDIEWELDHDVSDLEYEDDDYVDAEEHQDLQRQHDHLQIKFDELSESFNDLTKLANEYAALNQQLSAALAKTKKPFWKIW